MNPVPDRRIQRQPPLDRVSGVSVTFPGQNHELAATEDRIHACACSRPAWETLLISTIQHVGVQRRQYLAGLAASTTLPVAGCLGGDTPEDTGTPTDARDTGAFSSSVGVNTSVTARQGDGTLSIQWRAATLDAFTWPDSGDQFYEAGDDEQFLILQLALQGSRPLDFSWREVDASADDTDLGTQTFTGQLSVDSIPSGEHATGWRAYRIPANTDVVSIEHREMDYSYATEWSMDRGLAFDVSAYSP